MHTITSHDTFSTAFSIINLAEFLECFIQWIVDLAHPQGKHVAIDGKAIRAACEVEAKTNEIKGIPDLLAWLDISGAVVTTDAIGCQTDIIKLIFNKGADFVLPVKKNQANLHKDIDLEMDMIVAQQQIEASLAKEYPQNGRYGVSIKSEHVWIKSRLGHPICLGNAMYGFPVFNSNCGTIKVRPRGDLTSQALTLLAFLIRFTILLD